MARAESGVTVARAKRPGFSFFDREDRGGLRGRVAWKAGERGQQADGW